MGQKKLSERAIEWGASAVAHASILIIALIFLFLFAEGYKIFAYDDPLHIFFGTDWQPTSQNPRYEMLALIVGSLVVTLGAMLIAIPLGVGCAIYLSEIAPPHLAEILKPIIEILAGIPSVVLGFFALVVLAPLISLAFGVPSGLTALNGALILAVMILPTIETISEDALRAVPKGFREASFAMGATHWETIRHVAVPAAMPGITVAILLGFGRAIGETMVVLMATGNASIMPTGLLDPVRAMTSTIASEMGEVAQGSAHYFALFMVGCILFAISFAVNLAASMIVKRGQNS